MKVFFINRQQLLGIKIASVLVSIALVVTIIQLGKQPKSIAATGHASYESIVIDAGHGGFDPGAVGTDGTREDVICLSIAKALQQRFIGNGYQVIMTRTNNNAVGSTKAEDMAMRKSIINNSHATVVVSIHLNSYNNANYYGAQTFYYKGSDQSKRLAESIQQQIKSVVNESNRSEECVANDSFLILKSSDAPSVLVECGFLSNAIERNKLKQEAYQQNLAESIYVGVINFLE